MVRAFLGLGGCLVLLAGVSVLQAGGEQPRGLPQTQPGESTARTQPTQGETDASSQDGLFGTRKKKSLKTRPGRSTQSLLGQMLAIAVVIVVLGATAAVIFKKVLPRLRTGGDGRRIRLTETTYLGPRQAVHLLEVGKRTLLVGATRERLTMLADVTDEADGTDEDRPPRPTEEHPTEEFAEAFTEANERSTGSSDTREDQP